MTSSPPVDSAADIRARAARKLSVCILCRGSAADLRRCLSSVSGISDDVVVVASPGSRGITRVARQFAARLVRHEWTDDFSAARNAGLQHCSGKWALCLDENEWVPAASGLEIRAALQQRGVDAYLLPRRTVTRCAAQSETTLQQSCRLFRMKPGYVFEGRAAEALAPLNGGRPCRLRALDAAEIIHVHESDGKSMVPADHAERIRILEQDLAGNPDDQQLLFALACEYYSAADFVRAEPCSREHAN